MAALRGRGAAAADMEGVCGRVGGQRAVEEARELSQADFAANNKVPAGIPAASVPTFSPDRVPSHGSPPVRARSSRTRRSRVCLRPSPLAPSPLPAVPQRV
eukprot:3762140-Rhodomonas_salina.1